MSSVFDGLSEEFHFFCFQEFEIDPGLIKEQKAEADTKVSAHFSQFLLLSHAWDELFLFCF